MRCTVGRPVRTSLIISVPAGEIREAHLKSCLGGVRHYLTMRRRELFGAHGFVGSLGRCRFTGGVLPFKATRLPSEACNSESSSAPVDRQRHRSCSEERGRPRFQGEAERGGFTAFIYGQLPGGGNKEPPYLRFQTNARNLFVAQEITFRWSRPQPERVQGLQSTRGVHTSCLVPLAHVTRSLSFPPAQTGC